MALGGQGVPRGRIIEVFGPESSGKTTLALHVAAEAQKQGGIAAIIDAEHAFDPSWGKKLGVELETLLVSQPTSGEEAMQITEMLIKSNAVDVIIIDSVAALVPRQELEGEIGDSHVGLQARLMSQSMRKLTGAIAKSKTCVIFINQIREKIGVMFGSPETTPGGRALKFYSSCRIDVRRIGQIKDGEQVVGQRVRCKVVKNKIAPPFRIAEFDMMHTNGISYEGDLLDLGVAQKVVARSGSWFKYGETHLGQGKEKARQFLIDNPQIAEEIKEKVLAAGGYAGPPPATMPTNWRMLSEPAGRAGWTKHRLTVGDRIQCGRSVSAVPESSIDAWVRLSPVRASVVGRCPRAARGARRPCVCLLSWLVPPAGRGQEPSGLEAADGAAGRAW